MLSASSSLRRKARLLAGAAAVLLAGCPGSGQTTTPQALVAALREGGHVVVMRHGNSPSTLPTRETAEPDNTKLERQLDATGREAVIAMGEALRRLQIPVGKVYTSEAYRTRETARLAGLPDSEPRDELGFETDAMSDAVTPEQVAWLQDQARKLPGGPNTFIITHSPNLAAAFPDLKPALAEGEAAVFGRNADGEIGFLGRIPIEDWPGL